MNTKIKTNMIELALADVRALYAKYPTDIIVEAIKQYRKEAEEAKELADIDEKMADLTSKKAEILAKRGEK